MLKKSNCAHILFKIYDWNIKIKSFIQLIRILFILLFFINDYDAMNDQNDWFFFFAHVKCKSRVMQKQNFTLLNIETTSKKITNRSNMRLSITIRVLITTERLITQLFRIRQQNDIITIIRFLFLTSFDVTNDILTALIC